MTVLMLQLLELSNLAILTQMFLKKPVKEQTFDHVYMVAHAMGNMEDYYSGQCLIPFAEYQYLVCEWSS